MHRKLPDNKRTKNRGIPINPDQWALIARAAEIQEIGGSTFVRESAVKAARKVLAEHGEGPLPSSNLAVSDVMEG